MFINEHSIPTGDEVCIPTGDEVCIALQHTSHHPVKYRITFGRSATTTDQNLKARLTRDDGENWEDLPVRPLKTGGQLPWVVSIRGRERIQMEICATCGVPVMAGPPQAPGLVQTPREIGATPALPGDNTQLETILRKLDALTETLEQAAKNGTTTADKLSAVETQLLSIKEQLSLRKQQADAFISRLLFAPDSTRLVVTAAAPEGKITGLTWNAHPPALRIAGPRGVPGSSLPETPFTAKLRFRIAYPVQDAYTATIPVTLTASPTEMQTEVNVLQIIAQQIEQALIGRPFIRGQYTVHCEVEIDANGMRGECGNYAVIEVQ